MVSQPVNQRLASTHKAPQATQRLAERANADGDPLGDPRRRTGAASSRPPDAGPVRFIDHEERVVPLGQRGQFGQRGDHPLHAEDRVGDNQPAAGPFGVPQFPLKAVELGVAIDPEPGSRQPAAIDHAGVIVPVAEDGVPPTGQGGDGAQVRGIAGREQQGGLGLLEVGQALFEFAMPPAVTRHEGAGSRPHAVFEQRPPGRLGQFWVLGEPQVVVPGEVLADPTLNPAESVRQRVDLADLPPQMLPFEVVQVGGEPVPGVKLRGESGLWGHRWRVCRSGPWQPRRLEIECNSPVSPGRTDGVPSPAGPGGWRNRQECPGKSPFQATGCLGILNAPVLEFPHEHMAIF